MDIPKFLTRTRRRYPRDRGHRTISSVNVAAVKPDHFIQDMNGDAVAVGVRQRRRNNWPHRRLSEAGDASRGLFDLSGL